MAIKNLGRKSRGENGTDRKCTEMVDEKHDQDRSACHIEILMERCGVKGTIARRQADSLSRSYAKADVAMNIGNF